MFSEEFWFGAGAFAALMLLRKPVRKLAVMTAGAVLAVGDKVKEAYHEIKEEIEDIVAEAYAANMAAKKGE
ncbi:MAG: hypothetical protein PWR06_1370 [Thermoanaerobacteraceae bacterium]|jgi:uncharacterized membrane protein YebE (DUF533 family)|uniref:DUF5132 domain-containing protein n=1 Tax=Biomaibacter acetigenes TaxID=2316383 RepID=A0A3G2R1G4_9FIRM|nr:DUF5132 domain-containing protein [Biomaibacter acetigenes]AYO29304.1 DUF5132 domain-containing protein [Biomaibacter acetigenes]MDK2878654.1 hypothetical protein [Thermoanaerobacteraceae bacterium]MDN5301275.1 hypothetical protein [Thermoanaerobacteraceae bacterium]RKL64623.1 DUF5132 domain-containing protein [Thermoanaerobacteraceae bacterium SP2]